MVQKIEGQTGSAADYFQEPAPKSLIEKYPSADAALGFDAFLPVLNVSSLWTSIATLPLTNSNLLRLISEPNTQNLGNEEPVSSENYLKRETAELKKLESAIIEHRPDSAEGELQQLALLEQLAQQYLQKATEGENEDDCLSLAEASYELMAKLATLSGDETVHARARYYDSLRYLVGGDEETARSILADEVGDLPEAKAILETIGKLEKTEQARQARDRHRMLALSILDIWSIYADEGEAYEQDQAKGVLGVGMGTIRYYTESGHRTMSDHVAAKWNLDRDLVREIKREIRTDEAETVHEALIRIAKGSGSFTPRAKQLLEEETKKDNSGSYILSHLIGYVSQDRADSEGLRRLMKDADESSARMNALQTPYAMASFLKATESNEQVRAECAQQLAALEKGKNLPGIVWDMIRTTGTDDLAQLAIMAGASKVGSLARLTALGRMEKAGVTGYKALALAYGAEIVAEGTAMWAMNTVYESMLHDTEKVFDGKKLLKSWGANLVMIAGLKGAGGLAGKYAPQVAQFLNFVEQEKLTQTGMATVWGLNHLAGLGGMIGTTQLNQTLGLNEAPKGGFKESLAHDLFSYVKYGAAQKGVDHVLGQDFVQARQARQQKIREKEEILLTTAKRRQSNVEKSVSFTKAKQMLQRLGNPLLTPMWSVLGIGLGGGPVGDISRRSLPQSLKLDYEQLSSPRWRPLLERIQIVNGLINELPKGGNGSPKALASIKMTSLMKEITRSRRALRVKDLDQYENLLRVFEGVLKNGDTLTAKNIQTYRARFENQVKGKADSEINEIDLQLEKFNQSLFALQDRNPQDPKIQEEWTVIADYLQQIGDPRGTWIALELERRRLSSEGDPNKQIREITRKIEQIRNEVVEDIRGRFSAEIEINFSLLKGFQITLESSHFVPPYPSTFIAELLASRYSFLLRGLRINDGSRVGDPFLELSDLKSLLKCPQLRFLTSLDISGNLLYVSKLQQILKEANLPNLKEFNGKKNIPFKPPTAMAIPFLFGMDGALNHGSPAALLLATGAVLALSPKVREGLALLAGKVKEWVVSPEAPGNGVQAKPERNASNILNHPLLAPFWMLMGVDGVGAGGRNGPSRIDDSNLRQLDKSLLALTVKNPQDPNIKEHWSVIADGLQEKADPRGTWIALEMERQRLYSQANSSGKIQEIENEINQIKKIIIQDIRNRFDLKVIVKFTLSEGFEISLDKYSAPETRLTAFLSRLIESEYGLFLRGLNFTGGNLRIKQLQQVVGLSGLRSLTSLKFMVDQIGDDGVKAIASSSNLAHLQALIMGSNGISDAGVLAIAASPNFRNLRTLHLWSTLGLENNFGNEGLKALFESQNLISLQNLRLPIHSDSFLKAIEGSANLPNLVKLNGVELNRFNQNAETHAGSGPDTSDNPPSGSRKVLAGPALFGLDAAANTSLDQVIHIGVGLAAATGLYFGIRWLWGKFTEANTVETGLKRQTDPIAKINEEGILAETADQKSDAKKPQPLEEPTEVERPEADEIKLASPLTDPIIGQLDESLLARQVENLHDPEIIEQWAVIADRLQEQGDPRGTLIMLGLERQQLLNQGDPQNRLPSLESEINRTTKKISADIFKRFGVIASLSFAPAVGFILEVSNQGTQQSSAVRKNFLRQFMESEYAFLLRGLSLKAGEFDVKHFEFEDNLIPWLANQALFRHMFHLNLDGNFMSRQAVQAIAQSSILTNLAYLSLNDCGINDDGVNAIANSTAFSKLLTLNLSYSPPVDLDARLDLYPVRLLGGNHISDRAIQALIDSPHLKKLVSFNRQEMSRLRAKNPSSKQSDSND